MFVGLGGRLLGWEVVGVRGSRVLFAGQPPSSLIMTGLISRLGSGMGSFSKDGARGGVGRAPVLEKAPDFWRKSARAFMPLFEPSRTGRERCFEAVVRIFRCWLYLGHSVRMCVLVSGVALSHGHVFGSGDRGRKVRRNSPV